MEEFPRVKAVAPEAGKLLRVTFADGTTKVYDCTPLLREPAFRILENEVFFRSVRAAEHGYGVVWDDNVDLAESELWLHGMPEHAAVPARAETLAR